MNASWQDAIVLLAIGWAAWRLALSSRGLWSGKQGGCPSCGGCGGKTAAGSDRAGPQVVGLTPLQSHRPASS